MASTQKNTFGSHQKIFIRSFRCDEKNIVTGTIEVQVPEDQLSLDFTMLNRDAGDKIASQAAINGVVCTGTNRSYDPAPGYGIYTYNYEGFIPHTLQDFFIAFELDVTMREEPIETHPNFQAISDKFFWNPITKEFARNIVKDKTTGGLSGSNDPKGRATNPLYGTTSYLVPGVTYRRSYAANDLPANVLSNIGQIVSPPGITEFPAISAILGGQRNWLKLAPKIQRRGNCIEITEEYLLSGPRGVNTDIYGAAAMIGSDPGDGSHDYSLSTGSLSSGHL